MGIIMLCVVYYDIFRTDTTQLSVSNEPGKVWVRSTEYRHYLYLYVVMRFRRFVRGSGLGAPYSEVYVLVFAYPYRYSVFRRENCKIYATCTGRSVLIICGFWLIFTCGNQDKFEGQLESVVFYIKKKSRYVVGPARQEDRVQ
jgi:hypothetical protein